MKPGSDLEITPDGEVLGPLETRSYARQLWWFGGGAVVAAAALVAYVYFVYDIDPPDDSDLRVEWIDYLDVRRNAYLIWREGIEDLGVSEKTHDWAFSFEGNASEWEPARALEMRAGFTRLLDGVEQQFAAQPPERFVVPRDHRSRTSDYESYAVFSELGRFSSFREVGVLRGRTAPREALGESVRFGRLFAAFRFENLRWVPLWLYYREFEIIDAALERLPARELDAGLREDLEGTLALWRARLDEAGQSYANEYQAHCDAMELPDFRKNWKLSRTFKKNMTKALLAEATRERMRILGRNHEGYPQIENPWDVPDEWYMYMKPNRDGIRVTWMLIDSYNSEFRLRIRLEALGALLEVKLALGAFVRENEGVGLPESLDALVPAYLEAVPIDPFDGKPVRFNREKATAYCVGPDLLDGGGECDFERPYKGKDVGLRVDGDGEPVPGVKMAP
jgi:hypothetical protein